MPDAFENKMELAVTPSWLRSLVDSLKSAPVKGESEGKKYITINTELNEYICKRLITVAEALESRQP